MEKKSQPSKVSIKSSISIGFLFFCMWLIAMVSVNSITMKHGAEIDSLYLWNIVVGSLGIVPFGYFVLVLQKVADKLPQD